MGKKRFSEGLEDLLSSSHDELQDHAVTMHSPAALGERRSSHKSFAGNLDSLLQEALDESLERYESGQTDPVSAGAKTRAGAGEVLPSASRYGIDSLIRQTIEVQDFNADEASGKKRLTVTVDRPKLEKLKTIAKMENSFLKDLLINVLDEYINEYVKEKGVQL